MGLIDDTASADHRRLPLGRGSQPSLAIATLHAHIDRTLTFDFALVIGVMVATLAVDAIIVPLQMSLAILLKLGTVGLLGMIGLYLPVERRGARKVLLGAALIAFGCSTTTIASWSPAPESLFHMMGTVLILGTSTPVLPYTPRESGAYVAIYALATGTLYAIQHSLDAETFGILGVLVITGTAAWFLARRMWSLLMRDLLLGDLQQREMEELARANRDLQRLASHDPLTGLANRRLCSEVFAEQYAQTGGGGRNHVAVLLLDLDHFKAFNDRHGHQLGDACLKAVSDALAHTARLHNGIAARFGGEEFVVVLRVEGPLAARKVAEDLRVAIERIELALGGGNETAACTTSIGIAVHCSDVAPDLAQLLTAADKALYAAKDGGRNRCELVEART
ncbi:GGDEF domain-containing protein [Erythrobacter mangrovi]|uniref:diguanylate cyclase n=1 Tax=Erythrobacter mangrovi TaxID=2739433 RepID=A0A7D3XQP6_9SPHN|nr:GGDEF domain-containing protein [Erythrobacter mangrovi]QKG70671.1 GGDEF domain-containing protein [Erythrobacter mangrovi]